MFLIYIDESGKHDDPNVNFFVLSAVMVHEDNWQILDNQITKIKIDNFSNIDPDAVELHSIDIFHGKHAFSGYSQKKRVKIFKDISGTIAGNDVHLISIVINKGKLKYNPDILEWAYTYLYERIAYFMNSKNEISKQKGRRLDYGLIMHDSMENDRGDEYCRRRIKRYLREGSRFNYSDYIIEDVLFVKSHWQNLSQLVDFVAFITRRKYRNKTVNSRGYINTQIDDIFNIFESNFIRKGSYRDGWGLKLWP